MHHCGPGESMATVLGMQDVPQCLSQHPEGMKRDRMGALWHMSLHMKRLPLGTMAWASLACSPMPSVGLGSFLGSGISPVLLAPCTKGLSGALCLQAAARPRWKMCCRTGAAASTGA